MRPAPYPRPQLQTFRPPLVSLLFAIAFAYATYFLYAAWSQHGWEWGTTVCLITGVMTAGMVVRAMFDYGKVTTYRRKQKQFEEGKMKHGTSRFATEKDIDESEFLSDREGIFMGAFPTKRRSLRDVLYDGPGSISAIAMPGQLKTMALVVPAIMAICDAIRSGLLGQNLIVNDPSGEVLSICRPALEAVGYDVAVMTPFPKQVSELIGQEVKDVGLDVFSSLHPEMSPASVRSELQKSFKQAMPGKADTTEKDEFFYRSGRMLGHFLAMRKLVQGEKPTLPGIRRDLMEGPAFIRDLFEEAEGSDAFGGVYKELSKSLAGVLTAAPQQFAGGYGVIEQHLDPHDHFSDMGRHTSGSDFDPRVLKDPNKKTALFLISTLDQMETIAPTTAMSLTYLLDTLAADNQAGACTAILDECGILRMPLASKLNYYRKANLRCLMIWQDQAQAEQQHGRSGMKQIFGASQIKIAMGISEASMLDTFSKLCGTTPVSNTSLNDRAGMMDAMPDMSQSMNHSSVPLMRSDAIRTMPSSDMLVVGGNLFPMILKKVPYWTRPDWLNVAGPSPYHRG